MTPYGGRDLGQHWFRQWLVAWWHQAITWTDVDLSSVRPTDIHLRASSQEIHQPSITEIICKIKYLKFHSNFPGANELEIMKILKVHTGLFRVSSAFHVLWQIKMTDLYHLKTKFSKLINSFCWNYRSNFYFFMCLSRSQANCTADVSFRYMEYRLLPISLRVSTWKINLKIKLLRLYTYVDCVIQNRGSYRQGSFVELIAIVRFGERFGTYCFEQILILRMHYNLYWSFLSRALVYMIKLRT